MLSLEDFPFSSSASLCYCPNYELISDLLTTATLWECCGTPRDDLNSSQEQVHHLVAALTGAEAGVRGGREDLAGVGGGDGGQELGLRARGGGVRLRLVLHLLLLAALQELQHLRDRDAGGQRALDHRVQAQALLHALQGRR